MDDGRIAEEFHHIGNGTRHPTGERAWEVLYKAAILGKGTICGGDYYGMDVLAPWYRSEQGLGKPWRAGIVHRVAEIRLEARVYRAK